MFKKEDEMQRFLHEFSKKCCYFTFNYYIASLKIKLAYLKKYGYEKRLKSKDTNSPSIIFNNC